MMRSPVVTLALGASLLIGVAAYLSINPSEYLWALSNGADFSPAGRTIWLAAAALLAILYFALLTKRAGERIPRLRSMRITRPQRWALLSLLALLFIPVFLYFRSRNHFLGDGWLLITLLENESESIPVRPGMGTILLARLMLNATRSVLGDFSHEAALALVAALSGALYLITLLRAAGMIAGQLEEEKRPASFLFLVAILSTTGVVQLYFGYVENYSLVSALIFAFTTEGIRFILKRGRIPWLPTLLFLLAVSAHWAAVILLPALVLLWDRLIGTAEKGPIRRWPELAWILFPIVAATIPYTGHLRMFTSFSRILGSTRYGILSFPYLLNLLNVALLVVPVALLLIVAVRKGSGSEKKSGDDFFRFLRTVALLLVGWGVVVRPFLGPRDWDLISFYAAPLALWVGTRAVFRLKERELLPSAVIVFSTGLFLLLPWIAGNRSVESGAWRVARWVVHDPNHMYGEKAKITGLAWVMAERGAEETSRYLIDKGVELAPEAKIAAANMGILCWMDGDYAGAKRHLEQAVVKVADSPPVHYYLAASLFHLREGDLGEAQFRLFLESDPDNPSARSYLGRICLLQKKEEEALEHLLVTYRAFPGDADLNSWIGRAYHRMGNRERAEYFLRKALRIEPGREDAAALLAELSGGDKPSAESKEESKPKRTWVTPRSR